MGANPTRQPLQPEAIGAVMEGTKWLKPSITMCGPTRLPYRGRLKWLGELSEEYAAWTRTGHSRLKMPTRRTGYRLLDQICESEE